MPSKTILTLRALVAVLLCLGVFASPIHGQEKRSSGEEPDEVLKVNTELVQTSVMVFDKQGRFVDGLRPEQFELRVDGKPQAISFFDRVTAGSATEAAQISSVGRSDAGAQGKKESATGRTTGRRVIIFFIDDLHLSLSSVGRTRQTLLHFVNNIMGPDDLAAIASASGQIGFLQQFTDHKGVLRLAVSKLNHRPYSVLDSSREVVPMSEYMALTIERKDDPKVFGFFVGECLKNAPGVKSSGAYPRQSCEAEVKSRARLILLQAASVTANTYYALESLIKSSTSLPGRKLVFFISDGFLLDTGPRANTRDKLGQITDSARQAGAVIYSIDARGLVSGMPDATTSGAVDPNGSLDSALLRELPATQDALNALAADTGGRALFNVNYFENWISRVIQETSNYYLLAWQPTTEEQRGGRFKRIEVGIIGRPELTVRLPRGFLAGRNDRVASNIKTSSATTTQGSMTASSGAKNEKATGISSTTSAAASGNNLPTRLSVSFVDAPNVGALLMTSVQVTTDAVGYGNDGKQSAAIDVAGVVMDDHGKQAGSFKTRLNVSPLSVGNQGENSGVVYNHKLPLKPGIYQVRVAARDDHSGRVGSAAQWIEIPDLKQRRLTMSSLLVGGQFLDSARKTSGKPGAAEQVQFSVDRRFKLGSNLNFLTIIYNAGRGTAGNPAPELEAQIRILREGQAIVTSPLKKIRIDAATDLARIPYGADIALKSLPAGRYLLQVTVSDRITNASASEQIAFEIE
jgi:VWFA-related protein